jgi:hypothetical protein
VGSEVAELARRIDVIERSYEYLLAYAAQGRQDDRGTEARERLTAMHEALRGFGEAAGHALGVVAGAAGEDAAELRAFVDAVTRDAEVARGAVALVLRRPAIASLLVDNLNAAVHVRALLTDAFLLEQSLRGADAPAQAQLSGSTPK